MTMGFRVVAKIIVRVMVMDRERVTVKVTRLTAKGWG